MGLSRPDLARQTTAPTGRRDEMRRMIRMGLLRPEPRGGRVMNDLLEALSIMVIARVPECLAFHVGSRRARLSR